MFNGRSETVKQAQPYRTARAFNICGIAAAEPGIDASACAFDREGEAVNGIGTEASACCFNVCVCRRGIARLYRAGG